MIIHTEKRKKKNPRIENVSAASDPHVLYSPATETRVNYYTLIELQQSWVIIQLKCCLECDQTHSDRIQMFLVLWAVCRAVVWVRDAVFTSQTRQNTMARSHLLTPDHTRSHLITPAHTRSHLLTPDHTCSGRLSVHVWGQVHVFCAGL